MLHAGGFADPPPLTAVEARQQGSDSPSKFLIGIQELGSQAVHRLQGSPDLPPTTSDSSKARLSSGGAASTSDPGSRDFNLKDSETESTPINSQEGDQERVSPSGQVIEPGASSQPIRDHSLG